MSGDALRAAVVRLASPGPGVGGGRIARRLRGAALGVLLRSALRRRTLPELLALLDANESGESPSPETGDASFAPPRWRSTCLYRSLARYAALRARGEDARFVIGLRPGEDVVAHAWVEVAGEPVGEAVDPRGRFAVAYTHPPRDRGPPPEVSLAALRVDPDVILTELHDGTGVLLHLRTKFYYALNRTGVSSWKLLAAGEACDAAALAQRLADAFSGITAEEARADVDALLGELLAEGLVSSADAG